MMDALKKKWGPLPAWLWLLGAGVIVYYYRNHIAGSTATGTGTGSVAPAPVTPQPDTLLQPGQSVYDPNAGQVYTAPGGSTDTTGSGTNSTADAINGLTDTLAAAMDSGAGSTTTPAGTPGGTNTRTPPSVRMSTLTRAQRLAGDKAAPFGPHKPHAPAHFRSVGTGHGNWIYAPLRAAKRVAKRKPRATVHNHPSSARPRSAPTVRRSTRLGARMTFVVPSGRNRAARAMPKPTRHRPRVAVASRPVVQQHPVTHRPPAPVHPAHRPSAPPKRIVRGGPKRGRK